MTSYFSLALLPIFLIICLPLVSATKHTGRKPVVFIFGDSNSDTGTYRALNGLYVGYPDGRIFPQDQPRGRLCDGRLVIDFLCESLNSNYLSPYLLSSRPNFTNGASFAYVGASTLPTYRMGNLGIQATQFTLFRNISIHHESDNGLGKDDFDNALYIIDIGQNDLDYAFQIHQKSYHEVLQKIPGFIAEIEGAIKVIYGLGGKNFWIHSTGPFGCLPKQLGSRKSHTGDFDKHGCLKLLNQGAKAFNKQLKDLCQGLKHKMKNATIVYVDTYSIKYELIAKSAAYGFTKPLMACCGHGGPPYNFVNAANGSSCGTGAYELCEVGSRYVSWDGTHYTEAANKIVASKILSTNYSDPPLNFDFFLNRV